MPADLARRTGIELIRTGSWAASTGSWNPTREDILAAVKAQECPAVRRPRLKLGHTDERFNGDGEPALGWFENLRTSDGGHTLLADQVALPWLNQVQAAAYPDRSIEGNYKHRCSLGHEHPFVITAVALLGVTPPAVSTLKSVQDLPAMLGVAAAQEIPEGAEHVQCTVRAAEEVVEHTGAMVALIPAAEDAERLAVEGGESASELHLTLAFLGKAADLGARGRQDVIDHVSTVANGLPRLEAEIFSVNAFNPGDASERDTCLVWGVTGDMIDAVHDLVDETLHLIDAPIPSQHRPWAAHITAAYTADLARVPELAAKVGPIRFDRLRLAFGDEFIDIPLMEWPGEEPETADPEAVAAAAGDGDSLHDYWTKGAGLAKWRGKPHPWTALFKQLRKHLTAEKAKRTASAWFLEVMGHTPNGKGVKASDAAPAGDTPAPTETSPSAETPAPEPPAAEPEPVNTPDPKEDPVSTDLSAFRSRLGLDDTADESAITAAIDALKLKAETPTPTPEMVAASAAAVEKVEKAESAQAVMKDELARLSGELATIKASAAQTVKASFFQGLKTNGQLKPSDEETWSARYDRDPEMVTEILSTRAAGSEVPVMASGHAGPPEPAADDDFEALIARLDAPTGKAA